MVPPRLWPGPTQSDGQMLPAELEPPPRPRKRERLGLLPGVPVVGGVPGRPSLSSTKGPFFTDVLRLNKPQRKSTHSCFLCRRRRRGKYLAKGMRVRWWVGRPNKTLVGTWGQGTCSKRGLGLCSYPMSRMMHPYPAHSPQRQAPPCLQSSCCAVLGVRLPAPSKMSVAR